MTVKRIDTNHRMSKVVIHGNVAHLSGLVGDDLYASTTDQTNQILVTLMITWLKQEPINQNY